MGWQRLKQLPKERRLLWKIQGEKLVIEAGRRGGSICHWKVTQKAQGSVNGGSGANEGRGG
uniref:Uncharacterized protein n=1 Tax=Rhizophora mucronata TaxID=61149 RepID=A0A2P2QYC7_RHIMU